MEDQRKRALEMLEQLSGETAVYSDHWRSDRLYEVASTPDRMYQARVP
jgi:hypothetical protein